MHKLKHSKYILSFLLALCFLQIANAQFDIPKKPVLETSVYDYINLLSASEKSSLENKLIKYSDTTSTQIVIAIISSTKGENIDYLGTKWAHDWGIGQAKEDNGVFILLAKDDRKIAIKTGYGVEHLLTDAISKRIITQDIIPYFKQNNYYGGLNKGADVIFEVLQGEYKSSRKKDNDKGFPVGLIFIIIFIIILISISKNRRGGNNGRGGKSGGGLDIWDVIILSNMGRGSFGGGSGGFGGSSGGGFGGGFSGGFGGGGFGGGGASGGW
ncbi:TPM domain-containing protein [Flavobacteriaceae bacterium XHP0103]|uniref:TPM domain-containing protein n=1 Tax=Marixanthotalea marina TaxID=2844359 RepID=UPI002989F4E2|nr:TPM domain-containing protein [Marixanthotalea marina]MBU3821799.1 TPM domain-containing protein [Marixanthotalea marina]